MLPATIPTVTVTARYLSPTGLALSGTVNFSAPTLLTHSGSDVFLGGPTVAPLDADGRISVVLPATDARAGTPLPGSTPSPSSSPGCPPPVRTTSPCRPRVPTVDLADLAPADPKAPALRGRARPARSPGEPGPVGPAGPGRRPEVNGQNTADIVLAPADVQAVPAASVGAGTGWPRWTRPGGFPPAQLPAGPSTPWRP